jgi:Pyruvate/2-oxoacid:ferredoxin oxidoreductase gamma subunit
MSQVTDDYYFVPSVHLAEELGNARAHNVVLLGALSTFIGDVPPEVWLQSIRERVPKRFIELNERAFQAGREARSSKGS